MNHYDIGCEGVDWIHMARDTGQSQGLINTANFPVLKQGWEFPDQMNNYQYTHSFTINNNARLVLPCFILLKPEARLNNI
jgi:hypothetical protein